MNQSEKLAIRRPPEHEPFLLHSAPPAAPLKIIHAKLTGVSLTTPSDISLPDWADVGVQLHAAGRLVSAYAWWIGDWILFGEKTFGKRAAYYEAHRATKLTKNTLYAYARAAERVETCIRNTALTFAHHRAVETLSPKGQELLLTEAAKEDLDANELRKTVKAYKALEPSMGAALALALLREKRHDELFEPQDIGAEAIKKKSIRTGAAMRGLKSAAAFPSKDIDLVVNGLENGGYGVPDDLAKELAVALRSSARQANRYADRLEAALSPEKIASRKAENERADK